MAELTQVLGPLLILARLNEQMRSLGLEVLDPDLSMFTAGGGSAHCLAQALHRDSVG